MPFRLPRVGVAKLTRDNRHGDALHCQQRPARMGQGGRFLLRVVALAFGNGATRLTYGFGAFSAMIDQTAPGDRPEATEIPPSAKVHGSRARRMGATRR